MKLGDWKNGDLAWLLSSSFSAFCLFTCLSLTVLKLFFLWLLRCKVRTAAERMSEFLWNSFLVLLSHWFSQARESGTPILQICFLSIARCLVDRLTLTAWQILQESSQQRGHHDIIISFVTKRSCDGSFSSFDTRIPSGASQALAIQFLKLDADWILNTFHKICSSVLMLIQIRVHGLILFPVWTKTEPEFPKKFCRLAAQRNFWNLPTKTIQTDCVLFCRSQKFRDLPAEATEICSATQRKILEH
jgi:hypothetical protein